MKISYKVGVATLLVGLGIFSIALHVKAACNNANGEVYSITNVEIDMTSPDIGAVYKEDVCYFKTIVTTDNSLVTSGFSYIWYLDDVLKQNSAIDTYSTKFSEGEHNLMCLVVGAGTATSIGGCVNSDMKTVDSKPYKLNYEILDHTIYSPVIQQGNGYVGTSPMDKAEVKILVTLEGHLPAGMTRVEPWARLFIIWNDSTFCDAQSPGTYQPYVSENKPEVEIRISIQLTDKIPPIETTNYIIKSIALALSAPNNVGGEGGIIDEKVNP